MRSAGLLLSLVVVALDGRADEFALERQQIFAGYDGRYCKVQPAVESDGGDVALLTYQRLLLTGSDVFYGQFISRSGDGGRTWSEPKEIGLFSDTRGGAGMTVHRLVMPIRSSTGFRQAMSFTLPTRASVPTTSTSSATVPRS